MVTRFNTKMMALYINKIIFLKFKLVDELRINVVSN